MLATHTDWLFLVLQGTAVAAEWTYVWLALGGLLLVLLVLAFGYVLARQRWRWLAGRPALRRIDRLLAARAPGLWAFVRGRFDVQRWYGLAATASAIVVFSALYLFVLITEGWTDEAVLYVFDQRVYAGLLAATDGGIVAAMRVVTRFGDGLVVMMVSLGFSVALVLRRHRWEALALVLSVGGGSIVLHGLKLAFERSRPVEQAAEAAGHAFPSGHAFWAVTLYGFMIYLVWRMARRDATRIGLTAGLAVLIVLIGLSRVVLRVHWVSDVAGGLTVGLAWLTLSLFVTHAWRAARSTRREAVADYRPVTER